MRNNYLLQIYIMPFSSYIVSTSNNIIWSGANAKLSNTDVTDPDNFSKLLYNNNGEIDYVDDNMYKEIQAYPTVASFPAVGDKSKYYLDQSDNKLYRYAESQYFYVPYDVYSKAETDAMYRLKTDSYTKTEVDTKDATLQTNINTVSTNLTTETTNRTNADTTLQTNINTLTTNLASEVTNRTNADNTKIPYSGATSNVNLGTNTLTTSSTVTCGTLTATTSNPGTLGSNVAGGNFAVTGLSNVTSTAGTITTLGSTTGNITTLNSTTANIGTLQNGASPVVLGSNITGNSKTITGVTTLGATTANIGTLANSASNITLGDNITGNSKTITGLSSIGATTGTVTTLNSTTSNIGTLGSNVAGGGNDITGIGNVTSTTGTITTLTSTTATIPTLKATTIQNASGTNVAVVTSQGFIDLYGTSSSTGGIRYGAGKGLRETNEGKTFYNAAGNCLHFIGCNNDGTWANDNNIRMSDNVTIDNTLTAGNTTLGTLACGNTTVTGTCSVSGTTTLGTANITTANVSGTASCNAVTCTGNLVVGGNCNTIPILNYCVSHSQDFTAVAGYQTLTCTVPAGMNYRILSAMWVNTNSTYELPDFNIDSTVFRRCTGTSAYVYDNYVAGHIIRCTLVMDRNGP
jgi:hypothetical protein